MIYLKLKVLSRGVFRDSEQHTIYTKEQTTTDDLMVFCCRDRGVGGVGGQGGHVPPPNNFEIIKN